MCDPPPAAAACGSGGGATVTTAAACTALCFGAANPCGLRFSEAYEVAEIVGKGAYATVWRVVHRRGGESRAAKVIPRQSDGYNPHEAPLLRAARHPHIVELYEVFASDEVEVIVMELLTGGELFHVLQQQHSPPFGEQEAVCVVTQLFRALHFLHSDIGVVHRDVKLENILLCAPPLPGQPTSWRVKLVDFGFASALPAAAAGAGAAAASTAAGEALSIPAAAGDVLQSCCGSPNYLAPEMLRAARAARMRREGARRKGYGSEIDMWAAGVVLYVLLCRRYPFWHEKRSQWYKQLWRGEYTLPASGLSQEAADIIAALLQTDPVVRLTAGQALGHAFCSEPPRRTPPHGAARGGDATRPRPGQLPRSSGEAEKLGTPPIPLRRSASGRLSRGSTRSSAEEEARTPVGATSPRRQQSKTALQQPRRGSGAVAAGPEAAAATPAATAANNGRTVPAAAPAPAQRERKTPPAPSATPAAFIAAAAEADAEQQEPPRQRPPRPPSAGRPSARQLRAAIAAAAAVPDGGPAAAGT
eukprot:TRINITY_DN59953_c0_g1_i1.p1 TRINITY_DN59953_c0_g1~~TRINITY_DN59953_c0_g1_i1.p1  ORF type:complete len:531 (+),score=150.83 TRINITY_DN59953_c0_g1_i1:93-1685(+)